MFRVLLSGGLLFGLFLSTGQSGTSFHRDVVSAFHSQMISLVD